MRYGKNSECVLDDDVGGMSKLSFAGAPDLRSRLFRGQAPIEWGGAVLIISSHKSHFDNAKYIYCNLPSLAQMHRSIRFVVMRAKKFHRWPQDVDFIGLYFPVHMICVKISG